MIARLRFHFLVGEAMEKENTDKKKKSPKKFFGKKTKFFWMFYVVGILGVLLGITLLPSWQNVNVFWQDWGHGTITIILIGLLAIYLILYLSRKFATETLKPIKIITAIEFLLLIVLIVLCFLQQFKVISFIGPCLVFGITLWLRGVNYVIKAYLFQHQKDEQPYPVYILIIAILLISLGSFLLANNFAGNGFMWAVSISMILASIFCFIYGFIVIPKKHPKQIQDPTFEDEMGISTK